MAFLQVEVHRETEIIELDDIPPVVDLDVVPDVDMQHVRGAVAEHNDPTLAYADYGRIVVLGILSLQIANFAGREMSFTARTARSLGWKNVFEIVEKLLLRMSTRRSSQ